MNKLLFLIAIVFCSCSSLRKLKSHKTQKIVTKTETKTDSVSVHKIDSSTIFRIDSSHTDEYGIEVELATDTANDVDNNPDNNAVNPVPKKKKKYTYVVDGKEIVTDQQAKTIKYTNKSTGQKSTEAASKYLKTDSTTSHEESAAQVTTETSEKTKTVQRTNPAWIPLILAALVLFALIYFVVWLRRKTKPLATFKDFFNQKNNNNDQT